MVNIAIGSQTCFWKDHWCRDGTRLMNIYLRLYAIELFKECKVIDHWFVINDVWCGTWSCPPDDLAY